jgi:hypothetical protein
MSVLSAFFVSFCNSQSGGILEKSVFLNVTSKGFFGTFFGTFFGHKMYQYVSFFVLVW